MCLSVPAQILSIKGEEAIAYADGIQIPISLFLLDGVRPGDFVLIHSGFAIQIIDKKEADKTLEIVRHMRTVRHNTRQT